MIAGAVAVVAVIAVLIISLASQETEYAVLFSGMDGAEAGEVMQILEESGVDAKAQGNAVLVPAEQADELRLQLNTQGYPSTGINYDLYLNNASAFGTTDSMMATLDRMQLQENIGQTLEKMAKVEDATVMITMAEESRYVLSSDSAREATAAVTLELGRDEVLTLAEAETVRSVVAKSVPALDPDNITITDTNMVSYDEDAVETLGSDVTSQRDLTNTIRRDYEEQLERLFTPVFGEGNFTVGVNVVLNFDKSVRNSITLEPVTEVGEEENIGIITEMRETWERVLGDAGAEGEPGVDPNGGDTVNYQEIDDEAGDSLYYSATKEYNAAVNEINETLEAAQGTISDISCTFILNGGDELRSILADVRSEISTAIGVPLENITVTTRSFAADEEEETEDPGLETDGEGEGVLSGPSLYIIIGAGVLLIILVLIIIMVARSNKKKVAEMEAQQQAFMEEYQASQAALDVAADEELTPEELFKLREDSNLEQIKELVDTNAPVVAQLLRNWLSDEMDRR